MRLLTFLFIFLTTISTINSQDKDVNMFIFGHSLIDHRPPIIPTPSNETTVPHWLYLMSEFEGNNFAAGGQYGFLPQHANLPPFSQWGYDIVPGVWESDYEPFSDADISHVLITAANFAQWQAPSEEYPTDAGVTPINATEDIVDWLILQEDSMKIYIYENWPDMAPFISNDFPPFASEFIRYNQYTVNEFHQWWLDYHDALLLSRPDINVRMIPVGITISKLLTNVIPNLLTVSDLYEDDAPHGRASTYFLAGLITHMAINHKKLDSTFNPGATVHFEIINNLEIIIDYIWDELVNFNDNQGNNRVFCEDITDVEDVIENQNCFVAYPNPTTDNLRFGKTGTQYSVKIYDTQGNLYKNIDLSGEIKSIDIANLPNGQYFINAIQKISGESCLQKIIKH